jgi:hypothetical protein
MNPSFRNLFMNKLTRDRLVPDHLGQDFLGQLRQRAVRRPWFTVPRQKQQRTCEPLLGGVEKLIDEIFFDSDVSGQYVTADRQRGLGVELPHHFVLLDSQYRAPVDCRGRGHAL